MAYQSEISKGCDNEDERRRLGPYSVQSVGAAQAVSLAIGHNPGRVATLTVYQQAGTHFADLERMTGRVNSTWYQFNSWVGFELKILGSKAHHPNH